MKKTLFQSNSLNGFFIFLLISLAFIYATGQLTTPYIRHDDWEFMTHIMPGMAHHGSPWDKTFWEGRWVNFLWSSIAKELSVNTNYILFILGYIIFCWTIVISFFEEISNRIIVALCIFFCSAYADLSLWPATLAPSVWIAALLFFLCQKFKEYKHKITLFIFPILVMSYAPLVAPCFMLLMLQDRESKIIAKIKPIFVYYIGYVLGVFIIYSLNYKYHNVFGVQIAEWRHPNPIHSWEDLKFNSIKTLLFWWSVIKEYKYLLSLSSIILLTIVWKNGKDKIINIGLALAAILLIETALSIYTGVDIPVRAVIWPWFLFVSIIILGLNNLRETNILKWFVLSVALFLVSQGMKTWYGFYTYEVRQAQSEAVFGNILRMQSDQNVFLCGNIRDAVAFNHRELKPLTLAIWKKNGIILKQASEDECIEKLKGAGIGLHKVNNKSYYKFN